MGQTHAKEMRSVAASEEAKCTGAHIARNVGGKQRTGPGVVVFFRGHSLQSIVVSAATLGTELRAMAGIVESAVLSVGRNVFLGHHCLRDVAVGTGFASIDVRHLGPGGLGGEARGANIGNMSEDGITPLNVASAQGHQEVVRTLLEAGMDVNSADRDGVTPLYVASENGHQEVVRTLLEAGADVNSANEDGFTPLYVASSQGHQEVVRTL
eukprot:CAMPEP_0175829722 /NCGR_PEP_ID=MMETSP0107_2-20121207/13509_1 /TAXON_ID=195067 ORGANISM="Goniomonas pacifica, Strain CCMP1869" /NCGR_SAMPLE_ID=MMETSP0107_2 /ASSEMBLY_ACC=CAM_ASM_000203 /LENGTH=210 /DNA_ID=CAMNT_0017142565 /DNA_START=59 /DNA_END=688 /DNA_ORIENTATION=+